jgi:formiminotetrahydrofolate cyclodeaminase
MVAKLTLGRKAYAAFDAEMRGAAEQAERLRASALRLMRADSEAVDAMMATARLPKVTDEEAAERAAAMREASLRSTQVPLELVAVAAEILSVSLSIRPNVNRNAAPDLDIGIVLARSALEAAILIVDTNLPWIEDERLRSEMAEELNRHRPLLRRD